MAGLGVNPYDNGSIPGLEIDQYGDIKLPNESLDKNERYPVEIIIEEFLGIVEGVEAARGNELDKTYHQRLVEDQELRERSKQRYPPCA